MPHGASLSVVVRHWVTETSSSPEHYAATQTGGPAHALNIGLVHDIVLQDIATECVTLVARQFDRHLDWSLASLVELDAAYDDLLADGPLGDQRLDLWWRLIGAYTGEVLVRVYGGQWVAHEQAPGSFAVSVGGMTAFPFAVTDKVLRAEPYKSLASFRACASHDRRAHSGWPVDRVPAPEEPAQEEQA